MEKRKIFGVGLSRTGTVSLTSALEQLGFSSIHFPHDRVTQQELTEYYSDRSRPLQFTLARRYEALTDTPIVSVYGELAELYPESLFILTVRDVSAWLDGCERFWAEVMWPLL